MKFVANCSIALLFIVAVTGTVPVEAAQDDPALTVNGETLSKGELNERVKAQVKRLKNALSNKKGQSADKVDTMRDRIRKQTITKSVRELVLKTKAEEAGTSVSDERVDEELEKQRSKVGSEEFKNILKQQGMSEDEFRDTLRQQLTIRSFLDSKTDDVSVSDEEAKQFYDRRKSKMKAESFEEAKGQIKAMLKQRKKQKAQLEATKTLREESDVTVHVEK